MGRSKRENGGAGLEGKTRSITGGHLTCLPWILSWSRLCDATTFVGWHPITFPSAGPRVCHESRRSGSSENYTGDKQSTWLDHELVPCSSKQIFARGAAFVISHVNSSLKTQSNMEFRFFGLTDDTSSFDFSLTWEIRCVESTALLCSEKFSFSGMEYGVPASALSLGMIINCFRLQSSRIGGDTGCFRLLPGTMVTSTTMLSCVLSMRVILERPFFSP
ncbi:hypothetical protein BJY01DRAFT_186549 [Aspergillus pseudoustus]|uniref:Uncharacterized protein n=1 Tax=Aspergillus pseudoustus TaxID=1810923 RepID=A0ABR4JX19_9EURO